MLLLSVFVQNIVDMIVDYDLWVVTFKDFFAENVTSFWRLPDNLSCKWQRVQKKSKGNEQAQLPDRKLVYLIAWSLHIRSSAKRTKLYSFFISFTSEEMHWLSLFLSTFISVSFHQTVKNYGRTVGIVSAVGDLEFIPSESRSDFSPQVL